MGIGKDCAIFMNINSDKYTDEEKVFAIRSVVEMPTHNGVTKDAMLEVIKYALRRAAEDDKAREEGRLVELPCKVGDRLYCIEEFEGHYISEREVGSFEVGAGIAIIDTNDEKICCDEDLGGYAYLSREQAQEAICEN